MVGANNQNTCCFFGHRTINDTEKLRKELIKTIETLITVERIDTFLFGSKSRFDSLCLELVSKMKEKYPHIKRIYVRAEFPIINDEYKTYLMTLYDDTYYPNNIIGAGKAMYVERNFEMIDGSRFCIVYFDKERAPATRKSGTKVALDYAVKKGKEIICFSSEMM